MQHKVTVIGIAVCYVINYRAYAGEGLNDRKGPLLKN